MYLSRERITNLNTAQALNPPAGADRAWVQALTQNVRFRLDGTTTAPTSSVGTQITAGDPPIVIAEGLRTAKFIEESASATLEVEYYGRDTTAAAT